MTAYILRRLWQMVPTMLGVILMVFILFNWVGGDPAYILAGKMSNLEQINNIRHQLGTDQPYSASIAHGWTNGRNWCWHGSGRLRPVGPVGIQ